MRIITGGTDTHMVMIDVTPLGVNGLEAETLLNNLGLVTNKNMIPYDQLPPSCGSGLRIGSPTNDHPGRQGGGDGTHRPSAGPGFEEQG